MMHNNKTIFYRVKTIIFTCFLVSACDSGVAVQAQNPPDTTTESSIIESTIIEQEPADARDEVAEVDGSEIGVPEKETENAGAESEEPEATTVTKRDTLDDMPTQPQAISFLLAGSFGPTDPSVKELEQLGYSDWFKNQVNEPMTSYLDETVERLASETAAFSLSWERFPKEIWYRFAITGDDQLRQRVAFALSQIFAVSTNSSRFARKVWMHASYMDIIQKHSFGNFRDLLHDVTHSPMMAMWLSYMYNKKSNEETGQAPDENYAREIMQLFTIGLTDLNIDGSAKLDNNGDPIETYVQEDVTELAKVFTGLNRATRQFGKGQTLFNQYSDKLPLEMVNAYHSTGEKTFLGKTIPDLGDGDADISAALDILFEHPNTAPFISKQLIQRLTTSNPSPAYVTKVANAFIGGSYWLPDGTMVGTGEYGDLEATVAAILLNHEARSDKRFDDPTYGKVRAPILRFVQWARISGVETTNFPSSNWESFIGRFLGQRLPYRAASVFNYFRPGYVAAGTETALAGLVAPEMQIESGTNLLKYINGMRRYVLTTKETSQNEGFYPNYNKYRLDRMGPTELVNYLNLMLTGNRMHEDTVRAMDAAVRKVTPALYPEWQTRFDMRVRVAMMMAVNTIEFKVQR